MTTSPTNSRTARERKGDIMNTDIVAQVRADIVEAAFQLEHVLGLTFKSAEAYEHNIALALNSVKSALQRLSGEGEQDQSCRAVSGTAGWRSIIQKAHDAYTETIRNHVTTGGTEAERRFSAGEAEDHADERMHDALTYLTFEHVCELLAERGTARESKPTPPPSPVSAELLGALKYARKHLPGNADFARINRAILDAELAQAAAGDGSGEGQGARAVPGSDVDGWELHTEQFPTDEVFNPGGWQAYVKRGELGASDFIYGHGEGQTEIEAIRNAARALKPRPVDLGTARHPQPHPSNEQMIAELLGLTRANLGTMDETIRRLKAWSKSTAELEAAAERTRAALARAQDRGEA